MAKSFASDIRPLFRSKDINAMRMFGSPPLDLEDYDDVFTRAYEILDKVETQEMPCDASGKWGPEKVDIFRRWIADGKLP